MKGFQSLCLAVLVGFAMMVQAVGAGDSRTAAGVATVVNGFVVAITVTDDGAGYGEPPAITISGGGGIGAMAVATVSAQGAVDKIIVQLESSSDLLNWRTHGIPFLATSSGLSQDFDVTSGSRYFRMFEVQR